MMPRYEILMHHDTVIESGLSLVGLIVRGYITTRRTADAVQNLGESEEHVTDISPLFLIRRVK